jgi:hypothetical protein
MRLIAHKGNINGPDPERENTIPYIEDALSKGYDVEVDIRYDVVKQEFWLGHDNPDNLVTIDWLTKHGSRLWIHCKDIFTFDIFSTRFGDFNYFWHDQDDYTLTSRQRIWAFPGKTYTRNTVVVMPESVGIDFDTLKVTGCFGVCSDYVGKL